MTKAYPIFIKQKDNDFLVYVPDMDIYTEGNSFANAISMARDAIGHKGIEYKESKINLPEPSIPEKAIQLTQKDADEDFDYSTGTLTFVDVNFKVFFDRARNRTVKKNCTIPYWLNEKAEAMGINFSQTLQEALQAKIG